MEKLRPGQVRDGIDEFFRTTKRSKTGASLSEISDFLDDHIGTPVPRSSVRSYLNLNTPSRFERVGRGQYRIASASRA